MPLTDVWVQQDAPQMIRDKLRSFVDKPDFVRSNLPEKWTPRDGPRCVVKGNGTTVSGRAHTAESVLVTVFAEDSVRARNIMSKIDAYFRTPLSFMWGLSIRPSTGLVVVRDSKLGGAWMASVTYHAVINRKVVL